jgi:two-component system, OmpR family, response regulator
MRILVAEDDRQMLGYLSRGLTELGHLVVPVESGQETVLLATREKFDVIVLDRMLPGVDGLTALKSIRAAGVQTPVLFLTALTAVTERVSGLEAGGDDYLGKPFEFSEFVARVNALGRRPSVVPIDSTLRVRDLQLDTRRHLVSRAGRPIELQPREFRLLEYLMRNAGNVVTRAMLLEHVWEFNFEPKAKVVEAHVSRLRTKIDKGFSPPLIRTVRGHGYSIHAPE